MFEDIDPIKRIICKCWTCEKHAHIECDRESHKTQMGEVFFFQFYVIGNEDTDALVDTWCQVHLGKQKLNGTSLAIQIYATI